MFISPLDTKFIEKFFVYKKNDYICSAFTNVKVTFYKLYNKKMKGMKGTNEFLIVARQNFSGRLLFGSVMAHSLRDAWSLFKNSHKHCGYLSFHHAETSERFYYKLY